MKEDANYRFDRSKAKCRQREGRNEKFIKRQRCCHLSKEIDTILSRLSRSNQMIHLQIQGGAIFSLLHRDELSRDTYESEIHLNLNVGLGILFITIVDDDVIDRAAAIRSAAFLRAK